MTAVNSERRGAVAVITIDHPPVNALSRDVRRGLVVAMDQAAADDGVQAVVLCAAGRTFIAGADIREFGQPPAEPYLPDVVMHIESMAKPVVAALHGTALGGGLEIAMGCHYRVAAASAMLGLPEVNLGLLPGAGGTQQLPRLAGIDAALDMMLSGKPVSAGRALELGIVDALADDTALLDTAIREAEAAAGGKPRRVSELPVRSAASGTFERWRETLARSSGGLLAPREIVACVEAAATMSFDDGRRFEREAFLRCMASPQSAGLRHAFFAERAVARVPGMSRATHTRDIAAVAVIGAGTMGAGIAYSCLYAGFAVHLIDSDAAGLERGTTAIRKLLESGLERGKVSPVVADACLARFTASTALTDAANADLVIEAVFESMAIKKDVFGRLGAIVRDDAILATNTSTLDVDAIAAASGRPKQVIGLHFFSPAHIMRLLEIVRGADTADAIIATALGLARQLGKVGVVVGNCFGFVGNRMLYSYGRENQLLLLEGAAPEYIDRVLTDWGMAMGPNAVGDLAGLDVGYKVRAERTDLPKDPRFYRIADMLVERGRYGQKTGLGMYRYEEGSRRPLPDPEVQQMINDEAARLGVRQRSIEPQEIIERCIFGLITEGARIVADGIASRPADIDVVWINGYGFPRYRGGPMFYADNVGVAKVYETVCRFRDRYGEEFWTPPELLEELARSNRSFADLG